MRIPFPDPTSTTRGVHGLSQVPLTMGYLSLLDCPVKRTLVVGCEALRDASSVDPVSCTESPRQLINAALAEQPALAAIHIHCLTISAPRARFCHPYLITSD